MRPRTNPAEIAACRPGMIPGHGVWGLGGWPGTIPGLQSVSRRQFLAASVAALAWGCGAGSEGSRAKFTVWGGPGRRDGQFIKPRGIAVSQGEVYVIDTTGRVQVFTVEGKFLRLWNLPAAENGTPTSMAFTPDGHVVIPDTHYSRILTYTRDGKLTDQWGSYGDGPGQFVYPTGVVVEPDGTMYISEYGERAERVRAFDAAHQVVAEWGGFGEALGQLNRATAIVEDKAGTLYVSDTGNNRVQKFDKKGTPLGILGGPGSAPGQLTDPFGIALGPDGSLMVCEFGNHRLSRFAATGALVAVYGAAGREPGQFNGPRGIAVLESGAVLVADTDNHRIQRLEPA